MTIPVQRRDRPWINMYVTMALGPMQMPSTDAMRQAVTAVADRYPDSRLTWSLDPTGRYWSNDRTAESVVVERDWDSGMSPGAVLDVIERDESIAGPFNLIRYPDHIGIKLSHSVGDGLMQLMMVVAVFWSALTGEVVPWPAQPSGRFPLTAAALRTFGRHPSLIKSAVKDRFVADDVAMATETRPWTRSRRTLNATMPRAKLDEIFSWGQRFAPNATQTSLQISVMLRALRRAGMDISSDVRVIVDLRRYIGWRYIDGNFVAGVPMRIAWDMVPGQISATIKATNASARPLANHMLTSMYLGKPFPMPTSVEVGALPQVTFTHIAQAPQIDGLPWHDGSPVYAAAAEPAGPLGLTLLFGESAYVASFNACFHDNVIDSAVVDEALRLITSDPIDLLSQPVEVL